MERHERQEHLRSLVLSRAWTEIVLPEYESRLMKEMALLIKDGDPKHQGVIDILLWAMAPEYMKRKEARARGRIAALRALIAWPRQEVEITDIDEAQERVREEALARYTHYADRGWRSPVIPPSEETS